MYHVTALRVMDSSRKWGRSPRSLSVWGRVTRLVGEVEETDTVGDVSTSIVGRPRCLHSSAVEVGPGTRSRPCVSLPTRATVVRCVVDATVVGGRPTDVNSGDQWGTSTTTGWGWVP